jgi:multiple sugar transport system substrate-binding protein
MNKRSTIIRLFLIVAMLSLGVGVAAAQDDEPLGPVTIQFSGWTYDLEKVQENLAQFEDWVATQADPAIEVSVEMSDAGYGEFDTHVTTAFAAGNSFDVLYGSDHWLAKWAEAGWIVPLEDYYPEVVDYVPDIAPYSVEAMTYNGKLYGLPYYTDAMYFFYNTQMLEDAGIEAPPTTWAEVTEQALILKEAGITDTPVMIGLAASSWFEEAFFAMVYSEGGALFDENLDPIFATDSGPLYDVIEWLAAALNDDEIMPQSVLEMTAVDVQEAFKSGDAAFVIVSGYMAMEFNQEDLSEVAGLVDIAMMPGATHETDGYSRMYLMGNSAVEDEVLMQASWDLIEFLGGNTEVDGEEGYHVAKRWAVENGLGFSISSLWDDPEVEEVFSAMADIDIMQTQKELARSKEGIAAPWFAEWISFVRTEVQKAILRQESTEDVLARIETQWNDLTAESE